MRSQYKYAIPLHNIIFAFAFRCVSNLRREKSVFLLIFEFEADTEMVFHRDTLTLDFVGDKIRD